MDDTAYDAVITSGDVTRRLIEHHAGRKIFHIGPPHDVSVMAGIDVVHGTVDEAAAVVCVGLRDDRRETLADYEELLDALRKRDLEMICANPDKVVRVGDRFIYCAAVRLPSAMRKRAAACPWLASPMPRFSISPSQRRVALPDGASPGATF